MQLNFKLLLLLCLLLLCGRVSAQVCTGSLGDPVFTFDFGSGTTPKFPTTDYTFVGGSCPNDGQYALSKTETGCHDDTWHQVLHDHTGNDGYMMVVNADEVADKVFFTKETNIEGTNIGALCEKTVYEFSAYILNLIKSNQSGAIRPRLSFVITDLSGNIIKQSDQFDIPEVSDPNGWQKYGVFFETPAGVTSVIVKMVNNAPGGNGNDLLLDDITFRPCIPNTIQAGFSNDASGAPQNQCVYNAAIYTITATPPAGYDLQWQENINNTGWQDLAGKTSPSLTKSFPAGSAIGIYQYRLGVAHAGNIATLNCRAYSNPVTININDVPHPPELQPVKICEGETLALTATGGATYKWTGPNLPAAGVFTNPLYVDEVALTDAGDYHVEVISAAGCSISQSVNVTVFTKPIASPTVAVPVICEGEPTNLNANAPAATKFSWSPAIGLSDPNSPNPTATPTETTTYTVTVTNANDCDDIKEVTVTVNKKPIVSAGNAKAIFEGQNTILDGDVSGDVTSFSWSPTTYLDNPYTLTPIATPPDDITYTLNVVSSTCGEVKSSVFVRVYKKVVVPNSFSPNNDGVNDLWNIEALFTYPESTTAIYNRNGQQVFFSRGYSAPWDGKQNGANLPAGTYYYVIDLKNGMPLLRGWVLIIR
ncbi:MAG: gliding motility-associated C-terminal domain-containing protein [Mucilaginibacter sp.]|nr:gliding motility-associated C-terminal domain-containing protein [Mucilaginibacter sp.]